MAVPVVLSGFLLAMQAAGAIVNINQTKSQMKMIQMGRDLEKSQFESNLETARAESAESSLAELKQLRMNIGNQIAINAARGTSSGAGSALGSIQASERTYGADEKARRMNLLAKEADLRAGDVLSGLHTLQSETKLGQSLTNQIFKNLPIAGLAKTFGTEAGRDAFGDEVSKSFGFGLNTIGSS